MYQIILNINKKQFIVTKGTLLKVDKLSNKIGDEIIFDTVIMIINSSNIKDCVIGNPYVKNIVVKAKVLNHFKDKKIKIIKFHRRKHYKLTKGHRQSFSQIIIQDIKKLF